VPLSSHPKQGVASGRVQSLGTVFLFSLLSLSLLAWRPDAHAEDADALLRQGVQLRKQGKDREAFEVFQRAVAIEKTPHALAQLGLSEQALGLWPQAEMHIKQALEVGDDAWIKKNHAALDGALRTIDAHLGSLEIWGEPAGAEVLFNDNPVGTLPATGGVRVEIGRVTFSVRARGYVGTTRTVDVKSGNALRENVVLAAATPAPGPIPAAVPLSAPQPLRSEEPPSLVARPQASSNEENERPLYARWWFWTAVAVVAAGGVTAAVLLTRGHSSSCDATASACTSWEAQ